MQERNEGFGLGRRLAARLFPVALGIGFLISVGAPGTYYVIGSADLHGTATRYAEELAEHLRQFAIQTPALWKDQATKYVQVLTQFLGQREVVSIRVQDEAGQPIATYGHSAPQIQAWWNRAAPTGAAPISYTNRRIGWVRIQVSRGRLLGMTLALFFLSTTAGLALAILGYRFPVKAVTELEGQVRDLVETIQHGKDESERFQAAAEAATRRFHELVQGLDAIVWEADPTTFRCSFISERAEAVLGYPVEQWLGQEDFWITHLSPEDRERTVAAYRKATTEGRGHECEYRMLASDGRAVWLHDLGYLVQDAGGQAQRIQGVMVDITARKQAEQALQAHARQLETIRAFTEEIAGELDLTRLLHLILSRAMELVGGSAGGIHLWDAANQVLVPSASHGEGEVLRPLRLGEGLSGVVAQRREGIIVNDFRTSAYATPRHLGTTTFAAVLAEPFLYHDRLVGVIAIGRHAAEGLILPETAQLLRLFAASAAIAIENARLFEELRATYESLERAQGELIRSEKLRTLGQMAAGIAHDLNNMLASVLGQVELLRLQVSDPTVRESLDTLEVAATDGAQAVRRLQDFARQHPGRPLARVDLDTVVREVLEMTRSRWKDEVQQRGNVIGVEVALGDLPPVLGHAPEIREALTNLIFNAVDAMPQGGSLTISAREGADVGGGGTEAGSRFVELCVSDTGIGMPEEIRQRIFDPFFTTKGVRGSGLGLSAAYGIMQRYGGAIHVESIPGKGTTFRLRFQAAPEGMDASPPPEAVRTAPPCRLLLIDDEPIVRRTLAALLREAGHVVSVAEGGAEGLAVLRQNSVDLVLTDLGMPEMSGWDVARAVKAATPDLPVILLTGWGDQPASHAENQALADRILGKPVRLNELLAAVRDLTRSSSPPSANPM